MCTTSHATLFFHCAEPSAHLFVWFFVDSLAIPTSPNIVNVFVSCSSNEVDRLGMHALFAQVSAWLSGPQLRCMYQHL